MTTWKPYCEPTVSPSTVWLNCAPGSAPVASTFAFSTYSPLTPSRTRMAKPVRGFPPVDVGAFQPMVIALLSGSLSTTSGGDAGKLGSGWPYASYSFFSLNAAAWMGMPVQWNANGKSAFLPSMRWYAAANSALVSENA